MIDLSTIATIASFLVIVVGLIMGYLKLLKIQKDNEYIKVINSKNSDIEILKKDNRVLTQKVEELNSIVRELDIAIIKINSVNLTYPFPFMLKDKTGKIVLVNEEWLQINQLKRENVIGKSDYEIFPPDRGEVFKHSDYTLISSTLGFIVENDTVVQDSIVIKWKVQGFIKDDTYIAAISVPIQTLINQCKTKN